MRPDLSVVLVVGERRERAARALESILTQRAIERLEVLLCDLAPGEPPPVPGSDHPAVRIFKLSPNTLFSAAKARGVREASAPIVAFVEEHTRVYEGWAEALIEAHRGPWAGVGAEVHNANPGVRLSRALEVLNYHPWLPPATRSEFGMLPGHNSSFKRELLLSYGVELDEMLRAEIVLHQRLCRDGYRLITEPAARFEHLNETTFGSAARGRFLWNRIYGTMRARVFGWPVARRLFYAVVTPLIPCYALARIVVSLARRHPGLLPRVFLWSPVLLLVQFVSACGHTVGLLFGAGDADVRFSWFEMNEYRNPGETVS